MSQLGDMYREARHIRRNMSERRLHPLESTPQQLASLPPDPPRHQGPRNRRRRREAQPGTDDEVKGHRCCWLDQGCGVPVQEEQC